MFLNEEERFETIWACRFCMMCQVADRVGEVLNKESFTPRGRGVIAAALEKGLLEWTPETAEIFYTTLNDGKLQEWCVGNYDHEELMIDFRSKLLAKGLAPEEITQSIQRQKQSVAGNRNAIIEIMIEKGVVMDDDAENCLYVGCNFSRETAQTIVHMGLMLNRASISFRLLPDEEKCGHKLYQAGDFKGASVQAKKIIELFKSSGIKNVMVMDADCYRMFTTRAKRFGADTEGLSFEHCTMVIDRLFKEKKLVPQSPAMDCKVTYQDPCSLARYCNQIEAPRRVFSAIGVSLIEMDPSGRDAFCCGGGGLLPEYKPEVALDVAKLRCAEASHTGAGKLVTACFGCKNMLEKGVKEGSNSPEVVHIVDLTAEAVGIED